MPNNKNIFESIPFIDLKTQQSRIRDQIEKAIINVLDHNLYTMGPEVNKLENNLSLFAGTSHTLSCSSGTDALILAMMAKNVKPGDAVFVPAFTFVATAEAVALLGAIPFFVDVNPDTFNICEKNLEEAISIAKKKNLNPVGIIPVDLFGLPADYDSIHKIAKEQDLWVIADAAQSFGATYKDKPVGSLAELSCTSFFPAKPLGAYGDGGAVFTDNKEHMNIMESCRVHGQGEHKYENVRLGMTGRLDCIQAAVLLEKLKIFSDEIEKRNIVSKRYNELLKGKVQTQFVPDGYNSVWAIYTVKVENRDLLQKKLRENNIPNVVYYPIPLSEQKAYSHYPSTDIPVTKMLCNKVLSLPMHPYLTKELQEYICSYI